MTGAARPRLSTETPLFAPMMPAAAQRESRARVSLEPEHCNEGCALRSIDGSVGVRSESLALLPTLQSRGGEGLESLVAVKCSTGHDVGISVVDERE